MFSMAGRIVRTLLGSLLAFHACTAQATPEETSARVLDALDTSGPFVFSMQGDGHTAAVWWNGTDFIVQVDGTLSTDTVTSIDVDGRLCAACNFGGGSTPSFAVAIDYPLDAPWMVFSVSRTGLGTVLIAPDNALRLCAMVKCKCVGPGSTTVLESCSDANCDNVDVCKKTQDTESAWCQWKYSATFCDLTPELPIIVDDEIDP